MEEPEDQGYERCKRCNAPWAYPLSCYSWWHACEYIDDEKGAGLPLCDECACLWVHQKAKESCMREAIILRIIGD